MGSYFVPSLKAGRGVEIWWKCFSWSCPESGMHISISEDSHSHTGWPTHCYQQRKSPDAAHLCSHIVRAVSQKGKWGRSSCEQWLCFPEGKENVHLPRSTTVTTALFQQVCMNLVCPLRQIHKRIKLRCICSLSFSIQMVQHLYLWT